MTSSPDSTIYTPTRTDLAHKHVQPPEDLYLHYTNIAATVSSGERVTIRILMEMSIFSRALVNVTEIPTATDNMNSEISALTTSNRTSECDSEI